MDIADLPDRAIDRDAGALVVEEDWPVLIGTEVVVVREGQPWPADSVQLFAFLGDRYQVGCARGGLGGGIDALGQSWG